MKIDLYDDGIGKVELVQSMGEDITVVNSARVSFGKHKEVMDGKDKRLIKYLIKHRHTSTLEHAATNIPAGPWFGLVLVLVGRLLAAGCCSMAVG